VSGDDRAGETPRVIEFAIVRKGMHEGLHDDPLRKIMRKRFASARSD
jgi:aspartyl/asparaginyl beta-hydroxylase (cupin superfamily)